jgi:hypothetical protein
MGATTDLFGALENRPDHILNFKGKLPEVFVLRQGGVSLVDQLEGHVMQLHQVHAHLRRPEIFVIGDQIPNLIERIDGIQQPHRLELFPQLGKRFPAEF